MGRAGSGHTRRKVKPKGRERRRLKAVQWVDSHWGKPANMLRKYRRTFGVDWGCAIAELQVLGVVFPPEYLNQLRVTIAHQFADERRYEPITLAGFSSDSDDGPCSDDTFAFIAGYTSGGVPYGVTGEESEGGSGADGAPQDQPRPDTIASVPSSASSGSPSIPRGAAGDLRAVCRGQHCAAMAGANPAPLLGVIPRIKFVGHIAPLPLEAGVASARAPVEDQVEPR